MRAHWLVRCLLVFGLVAACGLAAADELNDLLSGKAADKPAPVDRVISAESSTRDDEKIARRLRQIYTEIDVLQGIAIDVNGGIVPDARYGSGVSRPCLPSRHSTPTWSQKRGRLS